MFKVFFNNSGFEVNDIVVKFVWYYNNVCGCYWKKKIILWLCGYHGIMVVSGSFIGIVMAHRDFDLFLF